MNLQEHVCLMAEYNRWMNDKLYAAASTLSATELAENRGAFFGSVIGTLNHLVVADTIWLKRFAPELPTHNELNPVLAFEQPQSLDTVLFHDFAGLKNRRMLLDQILVQFSGALTEPELSRPINFKSMKGIAATKNLFSVLMHVFNHQTHHRGQATTLLSQSGIDVGVTDLVAIVPNV